MKTQKLLSIFLILLLTPAFSFAHSEPAAASFQFEDGVPIVNCSFNDSVAKRACIIDTGSSESTLPQELSQAAESFPKGEVSNFLTASGTVEECVALHLNSLKIDLLALNPMNVNKCSTNPHGVIGIASLIKKHIYFDFKNGFIRDAPETTADTKTLRRDANGYIYIPLQIGENRAFALFDTGVSGGGAVDPKFLKANPGLFKFAGKITAQDPSGASASYDTYKATSLNLGNGRILNDVTLIAMDQPAMWKVFNEAGAQVIIGIDVLKHYAWYLDLENNLFSLD